MNSCAKHKNHQRARCAFSRRFSDLKSMPTLNGAAHRFEDATHARSCATRGIVSHECVQCRRAPPRWPAAQAASRHNNPTTHAHCALPYRLRQLVRCHASIRAPQDAGTHKPIGGRQAAAQRKYRLTPAVRAVSCHAVSTPHTAAPTSDQRRRAIPPRICPNVVVPHCSADRLASVAQAPTARQVMLLPILKAVARMRF